MTRLRHAVIIQIVEGAVQKIEHGSFYRVLEVFKGRDAGLVEELTLPQLKHVGFSVRRQLPGHSRSYTGSLSVPSCEEVTVCPTVPVCILGVSRRAKWSECPAWLSQGLPFDRG